MELARIKEARLLAVTFPGVEHAEKIITLAREMNPDIVTVCRARFPTEADRLRELGVNIVIHEETATSTGMIRESLAIFEADEHEIEAIIDRFEYERGVGVT
jgi:CPA2 family monovalent cation:H+ antiporter-2